jgi:hypothetical protein
MEVMLSERELILGRDKAVMKLEWLLWKMVGG